MDNFLNSILLIQFYHYNQLITWLSQKFLGIFRIKIFQFFDKILKTFQNLNFYCYSMIHKMNLR